jgi:hypothetical protein
MSDYTAKQVAEYLGDDTINEDWHGIGNISTIIKIIQRHEPGKPGRDADMIEEAVANLLHWMNDHGVRIEGDEEDTEIIVTI